MLYLFFQIWVWLLIAFLLGLILGGYICWLCCKRKTQALEGQNNFTEESKKMVGQLAEAETLNIDKNIQQHTDGRPWSFINPPEDIDDLKRIKGVGKVLEGTLNKLGIYQFQQIAAFTAENINWVDKHLSFPGRIAREQWVPQAQTLATGKETDFSKKVDKGDVEY